jgi:N-methylhydantoinase B/oxoprolinase/acetone carboxylase alpha subunit
VTAIDPVTFEVIRHRLWAINDDQGRMAARMSASPTVFDAYDFNSALVTADGRGLYTGVYIMHHGSTLDGFVRRVLAAWPAGEIREGDMFFTNDPWWGALHANDGILAAPIFHDGRLEAWSGVVMHDTDVGSPVSSSFVVGARDRFGEAPLFPAIKLVENFVIREDIERAILRNSRTPADNALNMRARVAALTSTHRRINELIADYGVDAFRAASDGIIGYVERVLRSRLAEIPDGWWFAQGYLDHDGVTDSVYPLRCRVIKTGDRLVFDMAGTAPQAPGPINCARPAMEGAVVGVVLTFLCYDLPWAVGAVRNVISIESAEGTVNNATGAAAVSMASIMGTLSTQDVVASAFAKMLMCSARYRCEAQATWTPGINSGRVIAPGPGGEPSISRMPDSFGGGGGARSTGDGIDSGGIFHSMGSRIANAEVVESRGALLQVYRREVPDSGGPGRYRGGVSIEFAAVVHKAPGPASFNSTASGVAAPAGRGLAGGLPGAAVSNLVLRESDLWRRLTAGRTPTDPADVAAARADVRQAKSLTGLAEDDFVVSVLGGGAGYGDPIRRDPALVARDVAEGRVSPVMARAAYGVVLGDGVPDQAATDAARAAARDLRRAQSRPVTPGRPAVVVDGAALHPVADAVEAVGTPAGPVLRCCICHYGLGRYDQDYKQATVMRESPLTSASPLNRHCDLSRFVLREFFCPGCATCLVVDVQDRDEPVLDESAFTPDGGQRALSHCC